MCSLEAHDIICHISDAVLAGGVRRSALISIFSPDDMEMVNCKTGNWYVDNPQRGRANNSALLLRNKTSFNDFKNIMKAVKDYGEPGFIWSDNTEIVYNPCCEIGLYPIDKTTGKSGFQACNLTEINMKLVKTEDEFYEACRASAILGTLQAGYTDFKYLGETSENIIRGESLLGCSMTGMCDNPDISFNKDILEKGAKIIRETNIELARKIKINSAARTTCVKPAGSTSCILGTSSGIHPAHAKRYFRRVQVNKIEKPQEYFSKFNPDAIEDSVWSANRTDNVITFLCETSETALTKNNINAIELLKYVKLVQTHWVRAGKDDALCVKPWLQHNVSNTITVNDNEWGPITEYIYNNRNYFTGISILPSSGDKIYRQAPFEKVMTNDELVKTYGDGVLFSSGLIIHALQSFGELFDACDAILGKCAPLEIPDFKSDKIEVQIDIIKKIMDKKLFIERANKFARRYFNNDLQKMTYCLKDVNALKKWCDLSRTYKNVPWDKFYENTDNVKVSQTMACSGGKCELNRM